MEALKRAVFLSCYLCIEPACYTGLNDLNPEAVSKTMSCLNEYLLNGMADAELKWMLRYYSVWDFVFDKYLHLEAIGDLLKTHSGPDLPETIDRTIMEKRGQMGQYWNSLNKYQ